MLELTIALSPEGWDEEKEEFVQPKVQTLRLEHSLVSLSKWESKWHKPFLTEQQKTTEETLDYIKCMTLTQNVDPDIYNFLTNEHVMQINSYIDNPMSATTVPKQTGGKKNSEQVTSELIYYWMISLNIPTEFQKWHLNRLLKLIEVCNFKNQPAKKMSKKELMNRNAAINAARRKQHNSKG